MGHELRVRVSACEPQTGLVDAPDGFVESHGVVGDVDSHLRVREGHGVGVVVVQEVAGGEAGEEGLECYQGEVDFLG